MTRGPRGLGVVGVVVVIGGLLLVPAAAWGQTSGGIAGVVRDGSGGVLPGVTVEAASPALIEKVRAVVTDASGQYRIVDLRPGVYSVTFTLPGFRTSRREGLELTTGFTATVNAELAVGALEETITVTGASPIVDTQNVRTQSVLSHEYLETVPTNKTGAGYASLIIGAVASGGPDVGGAKSESTSNLTIHGSRTGDYKQQLDGMPFNYMGGGGSARNYFVNHLAVQETVLETGGMSAESETGGVYLNAIPKDGGNTFQLTAMGTYSGPRLAVDNLSDALRARGLTQTNSVKKIYDVGAGFGGPLKKDKLWFYTAHRWWGADEYIAGNYYNKTPNTLFYTPDLSRQAYRNTKTENHSGRLTWQAAQNHKITTYTDIEWHCACYIDFRDVNSNRAPEASHFVHFRPKLTQATWTYPATNRLMFQVAGTYGRLRWTNDRADGVPEDAIGVTELSTGYLYGAKVGLSTVNYGVQKDHQFNLRASASYVTGSHAFKAGYFLHATAPGAHDGYSYVNQSVSYAFRKPTPDAAPVPVSVTQWASPHRDQYKGRDIGLYAQDQWTVRRLTLNLGVRFDRLHTWVPAQTRPGGKFVPEFSFAKVDNVPNWNDINPRLGVAYDLFGNGKTAIKASLGRYVVGSGGRGPQTSPAAALVQSATRVWTDANGDYVPQDSELGPLSNSAFGTVVQNTTYADEILQGWHVRPYTWQPSASLQQELRPGLGLTVGYFRTAYSNFEATDNLNVTPADYSPYCVTAPVDARLPGGGGNQLCGLYDITPTAFGSVRNFVTAASHFGTRTEIFNGVDIGLSARVGRGGMLNGGVSRGKTVTNTCFVVDSPQQLYQCKVSGSTPTAQEVATPSTQVKFNGAYPLPWDLQASWTYQNLTGVPILANLVYTNAQIAPSLGRNLGSCGTRVPCNGTATVSLIEPGTMFEDRYTQLDLRLTKTIRLGRARLQGMVDAYNVFNASGITVRNDSYGPRWGQPNQVELGRLFKFGTQLDW